MHELCFCECKLKNYVKGNTNGLRTTIHFADGGTYTGQWLNTKPHGLGKKISPEGQAFIGYFNQNQRTRFGHMCALNAKSNFTVLHFGNWLNDQRKGKGKQFCKDGIYHGMFRKHRRYGIGIKYYNNGDIYLGQWKSDVHHGLGVLLYANGNYYEGHFARGLKNGEGRFFHVHNGQLQKGMWENDMCKTSIIQDEFRNQVVKPTPYSIPPLYLGNAEKIVNDAFKPYKSNAKKSRIYIAETQCLKFTNRLRQHIRLEPQFNVISNIPPITYNFAQTCKKY